MKRIIMIALLAAILGGCACAESVPSATLSGVTLEKIATADGRELPEEFLLKTVPVEERTEGVATLYQQISEFVAQEQPIVNFFKEEEIAAATAYLPEEFDIGTLVVSEYVQLAISGYVEEIGDADVFFQVAGEWRDDEVVLAMAAVIGAEDEETLWIPLPAAVEEGKIKVTFTRDALALMAGREIAMAILREGVV